MEYLLITSMFIILALATAGRASSLGYSFTSWFFISIALPAISYGILLCLPAKRIKKKEMIKPVENDEIFDPLFREEKKIVRRISSIKINVMDRNSHSKPTIHYLAAC